MKDFCKIDFNNYVSLTHDPRNEYNTSLWSRTSW